MIPKILIIDDYNTPPYDYVVEDLLKIKVHNILGSYIDITRHKLSNILDIIPNIEDFKDGKFKFKGDDIYHRLVYSSKAYYKMICFLNDINNCTDVNIFLYDLEASIAPNILIEFINNLVKYYPDKCFIWFSTSPIILSHIEADVYEIKNNSYTKRSFYGKRIQDVAYQYYGIGERPKEIVNKIDKMFDSIYDNIMPDDEIKEIRNLLGEDDVVIYDIDAHIEYNK